MGFSRLGIAAAGVTSYTDVNPGGSRRWYYRVAASDASGPSQPCAAVSIVNRPAAPADFRIATINTTTLVLDWRDTTTMGETGYRVERSTDSANWTTVTALAPNGHPHRSRGGRPRRSEPDLHLDRHHVARGRGATGL